MRSRLPHQRPRPLPYQIADNQSLESRRRQLQLRLDTLPSSVDPSSFTCLLQTCGALKALPEGRRVHALIQKKGLENLRVLCHGLITMYGKCGSIEIAQIVFDSIDLRNVVSWNAIIGAYILNGYKLEGLWLFKVMQSEGIGPNRVTFLSVLSACDSPADLDEGKSIHALIIDSELMPDIAVGSALVSMYSKCENIDLAKSVFDTLSNKDIVAWNGLITVYSQHGCSHEALQVYAKMLSEGMHGNRVTFVVALNACIISGTLSYGMILHASIVEAGFECDTTLGNALLNSYGKCEALLEAQAIFNTMPRRDVVTWNTFIIVCVQNNFCKQALDLFEQMQFDNVERSEISYVATLSVCTSTTHLDVGKSIHAFAIDDRLESNVLVGNALLCMYSNCGTAADAQQMFERLQVRTIVSWNAIISAYDRHGLSLDAREQFWHMLKGGTVPNEFTFATVISACANTVALDEGTILHAYVSERALEADDVVMNALVNMYGRCGSVDNAWAVLRAMSKRTLIAWTAMIASSAQQGNGQQAVELFGRMCREGVEPNEITFVSILSACSHSGLVSMSCYYFLTICQGYEITPMLIHYCCLIDLLGRAGMLEMAELLANTMPIQPSYVEWYTLLCACKSQGDVDRGVRVTQEVLELHSDHAAAYVSLSNIYAIEEMWDLI